MALDILRQILAGIRRPSEFRREVVLPAAYRWGPSVGSTLRRRWAIFKNPNATIVFGHGCLLGPGFSLHMPAGGTFIAGAGVDFRHGFRAEINGGSVEIGDQSMFSHNSLIQCTTSMKIGERVMFGQSTILIDGNHLLKDPSATIFEQGYDFRPLTIEDDVTCLSKATIINDLGTKSIVAANTVVNKPVGRYCVVGGVPARVIDYFGPPELAPAEWQHRLPAVAEGERPNLLEVSGHSLGHGGGVSDFANRFSTLLATKLDAFESNHCWPGAITSWGVGEGEPGGGGYGRALQRITRPAEIDAEPPHGLTGLLCHGNNDLAALGPEGLAPFEHALEALLSRHRSRAVFEEADASVTASPEWAHRDGAEDCSGAGFVETELLGATIEIAVPAAFSDGTIALGFVCGPGGGARLAIAVDGDNAGELDSRAAVDPHGHRSAAVHRLPGLSGGAHSIRIEVVEADGPVGFDYWQVEAEPAPPALVVLANLPLSVKNYERWAYPLDGAGVAAINERIRTVCAGFDERVLPVDPAEVWDDSPALFRANGAYPNDAGHAALAEHLAAASAGVAEGQKV